MRKIIHLGYSHTTIVDELEGLRVNVRVPYLGLDYQGLDAPGKKHRLFMYQHGGVAVSLSPFSCSFDSGCCGFIQTNSQKLAEYCAQLIHNMLNDDLYAVECDKTGDYLLEGSYDECEAFLGK